MPSLPRDKLLYMIQFFHPDKVFGRLPGMGERTAAMAYGLELAEFKEIKGGFSRNARAAAEELLSEPGFAARVERLPFEPGTVVAAVGDSITDDLQSWFEILQQLLEICRPADGVKLLNTACSGDTTTHCVSRFVAVPAAKPAWILCMVGTNDARLHGTSPTKTLVSPSETRENLRLLRNFGATQTEARWLWITVPSVIEEKIKGHWFLSAMQVNYMNKDLDTVAAAVRGQKDPCVDVHRLLPIARDPGLLLDDGLHPSIAGQKAIAKAVVEHLSE
jgi:lysophospholipase L1-like esterase